MTAQDTNPNNCATCEHKRNPDGGWCYMFRDEPTEKCMQHTGRRVSFLTLDDIVRMSQQNGGLDMLTKQPRAGKAPIVRAEPEIVAGTRGIYFEVAEIEFPAGFEVRRVDHSPYRIGPAQLVRAKRSVRKRDRKPRGPWLFSLHNVPLYWRAE